MSVVGQYTSDEASAVLRRQQRTSTILSLVVSLLVTVLLGLLLFLVMIPGWFVETKTIVTYSAPLSEDDKVNRPEVVTQMQRKPAAPSSSMAKVIASATPSAVAIPVPEFSEEAPSADFGSSDDFGEGWGSGGGSGGDGGGTTFFGQTAAAERVAFVIDYSASMRGERDRLMREELTKSLKDLKMGTQYQLIFFAGPAWIGGDTVKFPGKGGDPNGGGNLVIAQDGKTYEWFKGRPKGRAQKATWITLSSGADKMGKERKDVEAESKRALRESLKAVEDSPLVYGTRWYFPLEMALDMSPPPEVIFFMTDGVGGSDEDAKKLGRRAKAKGTKINCIAMMEPKAHDAMKDLAARTGGKFTIVEKGGKHREVPIE